MGECLGTLGRRCSSFESDSYIPRKDADTLVRQRHRALEFSQYAGKIGKIASELHVHA